MCVHDVPAAARARNANRVRRSLAVCTTATLHHAAVPRGQRHYLASLSSHPLGLTICRQLFLSTLYTKMSAGAAHSAAGPAAERRAAQRGQHACPCPSAPCCLESHFSLHHSSCTVPTAPPAGAAGPFFHPTSTPPLTDTHSRTRVDVRLVPVGVVELAAVHDDLVLLLRQDRGGAGWRPGRFGGAGGRQCRAVRHVVFVECGTAFHTTESCCCCCTPSPHCSPTARISPTPLTPPGGLPARGWARRRHRPGAWAPAPPAP